MCLFFQREFLRTHLKFRLLTLPLPSPFNLSEASPLLPRRSLSLVTQVGPWGRQVPVRLQPSAALPEAAFSPNVHRTLVSRGLQVFGVGVGVSVRAWVQWEAVREGCVCVCVCIG